ncbi:uncharacterized protein LOC143010583 [Genypterus blacodes]|uniref:uncharacterized protein LOC143010583 n=1 Tax=Genypterus blacodes TaxID=154954 RepID=UPI003F76BA32
MKSVQVFVLFSTCVGLIADEFEKKMDVNVGDDITLPCRNPSITAKIFLEWTKDGLTPASIFFFRGNRSLANYQNSLFKGRVQLSDMEMKNGDVSVLLKNVTTSDSGTYECFIQTPKTMRYKRANKEPNSIIKLTVTEPSGPDAPVFLVRGHPGVIVAVFAVAAVAAVCVVMVIRQWRRSVQHPTIWTSAHDASHIQIHAVVCVHRRDSTCRYFSNLNSSSCSVQRSLQFLSIVSLKSRDTSSSALPCLFAMTRAHFPAFCIAVGIRLTSKCDMKSVQVFVLFSTCVGLIADEFEKKMDVNVGDDITLPCRNPSITAKIFLEWTKDGLTPASIFFFRGNRSLANYQNSLFKGRVQLSDMEMKNGDVSVLLKNVTTSDSGTYECFIQTPKTMRYKRANKEPHSIIKLTVTEPSGPDAPVFLVRGHPGVIVAVFAVAAVAAVCVVMVIRQWRRSVQHPTIWTSAHDASHI